MLDDGNGWRAKMQDSIIRPHKKDSHLLLRVGNHYALGIPIKDRPKTVRFRLSPPTCPDCGKVVSRRGGRCARDGQLARYR